MFEKAKPARDTFTFSLSGMAAINSYAIPHVVADDRINTASEHAAGKNRRQDEEFTLIRKFEDALARYFAPGCCKEA